MSPRRKTDELPRWRLRSPYDFLLEAVDRGEVRVRPEEHLGRRIQLESLRRGIREWAKRRSLDVEIRALQDKEAKGLAVTVRSRPGAPSSVGRPPAPQPFASPNGRPRRAPNGQTRYDFLAGLADAGRQLLVRGEHYRADLLQSSLTRMLGEWARTHGLRVEMRTALTDPDTGMPSPYRSEGELLPYGTIVLVSRPTSAREAA